MADRDSVIEHLEIARKRFLDEKLLKYYKKWNKTVQYHFTDSGEFWGFALAEGRPGPLQEGQVEDPSIEYIMSTDTFIAISTKQLTGMEAYKQGLVDIKASMSDLTKLRKLD
jgi:hypothetical protein